MKYLGKNSLSSVLSELFHVAWWVVLYLSVFFSVVFAITLFYKPFGDTVANYIRNMNGTTSWDKIYGWNIFVKIIVLPYFAALVVLLELLIKKIQELFTNFKNDVVFNKKNVVIISRISKLSIVFSILTFSLSSLLLSIFMFILCEIVKKGTTLQEEHDFTV
jgi:hypothetical protein